MRMRSRLIGAAIAVGIAAGLVVAPASGAAAQTTFTIEVGAFPTGREGAPAESMRFFSGGVLRVHQGDVVNFTSRSSHTATLLPENVGADDWLSANATVPTGAWAATVPDPDEGAGDLKTNSRMLFQSPEGCGDAADPCAHAGGDVTHSGAALAGPMDFSVRIGADAGDSIWVVCLVHTHMRMKIAVVPAGEPTSTQDAIDAASTAQKALDADWAEAMHNRLSNTQTKHMDARGRTVWDAYAGYDNHWVSLLAMYPAKLRIHKGDRVRWHFSQLVYEDHTMSLPASAARSRIVPNLQMVQCDPDGDDGSAPDDPPEMQAYPFCTDPARLEVDVDADAAFARGDGVYGGGNALEHSGLRGANVPSNVPFDVRFARRSGDKPFKYLCGIHPFMRGKVAVS